MKLLRPARLFCIEFVLIGVSLLSCAASEMCKLRALAAYDRLDQSFAAVQERLAAPDTGGGYR